MAILDDLKGILSAEEFAKLEGNAGLKTKLSRGDELRSYYDGDEDPAAPPAPRNDPPPTRSTPPPGLDLSGIERVLDARLSKINETIESKIAEAVTTKGNELVNNAVKISIQRADELNRVYNRHFADFGEAFDSAAFNEFLEKPENKGRFHSITDAYEAMTSDRRLQKRLDAAKAEGKAEATAANSGRSVPGTTPGPMNGNLKVIMGRGKPTNADGTPTSRVDRAAAALEKRMSNEAAASA